MCRVCSVDASRHRSPRWRTSDMWQGEVWYTRIQDTSRASKHFSGKRYSRGYTYKQAQESRGVNHGARSRAQVWAGTIDAYDRAQFAPMAARACMASRGDGGAGRRSTDRGELTLRRPPVCPTHGPARARRARSLSLSHARTRHGRRIAASGYCEVLPACCGNLRFGSPQHFRLPHTREVAGTRPVRIPLRTKRGAKKDTVC